MMFNKLRQAAQRAALKVFGTDDAPLRVRENEILLAGSAHVPKLKKVSKYMPHQGLRETARRRRQNGTDWLEK